MKAEPILLALLLAGCDLSMTRQPRFDTYAPAPPLRGGVEAQLPPEDTVDQGALAYAEQEAKPPQPTAALLARGRDRFDAFCSPCHGLAGDGDGIVVHRGFPAPPSYHSPRLRAATAQHIFDAITNGYGVMYPYRARVRPADRWAIVAYIRALQLGRSATLADVPEARTKLP